MTPSASAASRPRRVLIAGLGVAGATLAWWLAEFGFEVVVVERSPTPRRGGYMIDFWGLGYDVAERMGVVEPLRAASYLIDELRLVGAKGERLTTIGAEVVRRAMGERFSIMRGDLAGELAARVQGRAEVMFDDEIVAMQDRGDRVEVIFERAKAATFDLVVGAEGLHSQVRRAIIRSRCERPLGYWVASFSADDYPHRDLGVYVSFTEVGRQLARYALHDGSTAFLFVFRAPDGAGGPPGTSLEQKLCLRKTYGASGWEAGEILDRLDGCADLYFDSVAQIRAPAWSSGRIALVGDAAYCPSLLAGEGASLGMAGAYILASELRRSGGDPAPAFAEYERRLRPLVERKQKGALWMGGWFAPKTALGLAVRNGLSRLAAVPAFAPLLVGDMLSSGIELPDYREPPTSQ